MGAIVSYLLSWVSPSLPALDTTPDPATGLSEKDRALISSSWALVADKHTIKENGVELFIQLFRTYPPMKAFFKDFKGMEEAELKKSVKLRIHANGVMYALSAYVDNLDDAETLVALVTKVAKTHLARNVKEDEFKKLGTMFVPYLKSILGDKVTPEVEEAWLKLLAAQNAITKAVEDSSKQ